MRRCVIATERGSGERAFTLVELLVVITVIALLASILWPSLSRSKALARRTVCQVHMGHLAKAWMNYACENRNEFVLGEPYSGLHEGQPDREDGFVEQGPGPEPIRNGRLYPYSNNVHMWQCPADPQGLARSFSLVGPVRGQYWDRTVNGMKIGTDQVAQLINLNRQLLWMEESDGRGWNRGSWLMGVAEDEEWHWVDNVALHHDNGANVVMADAHAEYREWEDEDTIQKSRESDFYWDDPDNPDWLYLRKRYRQLRESPGLPLYQ